MRQRAGRASADMLTVFISLGLGLEDLAAAALIYRKARVLGTGTWRNMHPSHGDAPTELPQFGMCGRLHSGAPAYGHGPAMEQMMSISTRASSRERVFFPLALPGLRQAAGMIYDTAHPYHQCCRRHDLC